ncbi:type III secretion system inner membrane ring subunit SctD [Comamonas flocculans]|uniref:EscD/YscD/HrpQ family type III secretion system inner membrane ring protein n=1 Tax=Comamonas flocculans TaxID=2597701 RepID=A0A5B8RU85_9BURK|nr:type III secretion system inner membrane ring subunit SctD [Comamonas flocculans]QEA13179.1 EscD/YscD/HrpQ family type III secretion system inner membrane ring protein [Comamonas flocculans]
MMRDAFAVELRVLDGRHAGASAPAFDGLLLGAGDEGDVILTDLAPDAGLARLHLLEGGRWLLWPAAGTPDDQACAEAAQLGVARRWGGLSLCVSAPHTDWPRAPGHGPTTLPARAAAPVAEQAAAITLAVAQDAPADPLAPLPPLPPSADAAERTGVPAAGAQATRTAGGRWLLLAALGLPIALACWVWVRSAAPVAGLAPAPAAPIDRTQAARRQLGDLQLRVAQVDPALRLKLQPRADGRVLVQGWVDTLAQFDRLAEALAQHQPQPALQVRVASELQAELRALLAMRFPQLDFVPDGPGSLRVEGIVADAGMRNEALAAVREQLPRELTVSDGLRLAEQLAPQVRSVLTAAGFPDTRAQWDGEQMQLSVALLPNARSQLENALVALVKRFRGLPLHVSVQSVQALQQAERGPAPFAIRSVVSGRQSYLVLPDGSRLLPGGTHAGWRLQSIEPELLIFDMPRRLVVER